MGLWSKIKKAAKKVGRAIRGAVSQIVSIINTVVQRIIGIPDWIGSLIGIRPQKKLRLKVVVLRDESGEYLASRKELQPIIDTAIDIYKRRCNVKIIPAEEEFIQMYDVIPPTSALDISCNSGAWKEDFGEAGSFFSLLTAVPKVGLIGFGYATPVTAIVVRDIAGKKGCSLGPLTEYVTIDLDGIATDDTLSHEIGHACSMKHRKKKSNLMFHSSTGRGDQLTRWQSSNVRWSKHVSYL